MNTIKLYHPDLQALDVIWPLGRQLIIPDNGSVVVAGCFKGLYIDYICTLYPHVGKVIGFEPQPWASYIAGERNRKHGDKVSVCAFGLAEEAMTHQMSAWGTDGCSLFAPTMGSDGNIDEGVFVPAKWMFKFIDSDLDLIILNVEGYENILIPHMHKTGLLQRIKSMAVQFHPNPATVEYDLTNMLSEQYSMTVLKEHYGTMVYDDYPSWTYWIRKEKQ